MIDADLRRAAGLVAAARRGLAFTGAGISAESGIRTFRGADGLWKQYDPFKVSSIDYFRQDPSAYWSAARERWRTYAAARPNPAHLALAELERRGNLAGVVTQNTDGLHLEAGSRAVVELHGNGRRVRCLGCGAEEARAEVQARLEREMPPICRACGGRLLKPAAVFFGEALPPGALARAVGLAETADLVLVIGSSLAVQPAAEVPAIAARAGAALVVVNDEPTPLDGQAAVVLRGRAGELLPQLVSPA